MSSSSSSESPATSPVKRKAAEISDSESADEAEEVVLSHAEQRRQKKKQKREAAPTADGKSSAGKPKAEPLPRRQNSVWVGNLAFKTTPISLKAFFDGVGEITRINMPMKAATGQGPKQNSGFAYVDFATKEAKVIAMTMSEQNLEGRRLLIKDGDDYSTKPGGPPKADGGTAGGLSKTAQKILNGQKQPPGPTLFFGNLGFQTTEASIKELLEAHRTPNAKKPTEEKSKEEDEEKKVAKKDQWIRKIRMGTFEDTGVCKGWAFVDFTNIENATSALVNTRNHTLDGRKLKVEYASPDAVRRGGGPGDHKHPNKSHAPKTSGPRERKVGGGGSLPEAEAGDDVEEAAEFIPPPEKPGKPERRPVRGKPGAPTRLRPGAALAQAQRATSAAIIPSQGKKITF